jgi:predicted ester cyclase
MTTEDNKARINRFIEETINSRRLDVLDEIVAEGFVEHVPFPGQGPGREGLRDARQMFSAAFPDVKWEVQEQIAEGDSVVTHFTWSGTHSGSVLGIPATGRSVRVWRIVIDAVRGRKFAESRIMDSIRLLKTTAL